MGIVREPIVVRPHDSLLHTVKIMTMEYVPKLIVGDENGNPLGIVSQKDALKFINRMGNRELDNVYVSEVMRKDIVTVTGEIEPIEAAQIMIEKKQPMLIVTSDSGKILGMIIKSDLSQYYGSLIRGVQKISEYMSKNPITVDENSPVHAALDLILTNDISRLIVTSNGKIVGTITTTDLLYLAPVLKIKDISVKVKEVMTPTIVIMDEFEDLNYAAKLMANRKVKGLPIVGVSGELKGILTTTDIVRALTDEKVRKYLLELKLYTTTF
ncbi:CBS domain-containing protein [Stygiolobus caldivivus]|uniref:Histidine kinase n=1 Tax=Stygiolobus caldivivus TaxID=2824673 RepID=A0A8D5U524_9CREN|nr:CBS domain-containing protein [Stygiolobus caldivivus]BCU69233.1 histidine kinase [Stygiolobus caldivivus]